MIEEVILQENGNKLASNMQIIESIPMIDCIFLMNWEADGEALKGVRMKGKHKK